MNLASHRHLVVQTGKCLLTGLATLLCGASWSHAGDPAPAPQCEVTFRFDDSHELGALQIRTNYATAPGEFPGAAGAVECMAVPSSIIFGATDYDAMRLLDLSMVSLMGISGPVDMFRCNFDSNGPVPIPSHFPVTVTSAQDTAFNDTGANISVSVLCTGPCGNDVVNVGEECDDGNTISGDGCTDCTLDPSTTTTTTSSTTTSTLPLPTCGDGVVEGREECDDGDTGAGDGCSDTCLEEPCYDCLEATTTTFNTSGTSGGGGPSICIPDDGLACDDGDACTIDDACSAGTCAGTEGLVPAACRWVMVGGDPAKPVQSRTYGNTGVTGHVCGDTARIGDSSSTVGDIVAMAASGNGIFFAAAAAVDGDIITDGAAVIGKPRDTLLPGLSSHQVAGGTTAAQSGDPGDIYDTTGSHPRTADCNDAQADIDEGSDTVAALPSTADLGKVMVKGNQVLTITATNPGGLNVIDMESLKTGDHAAIALDGAGNADTIFVLRVEKKILISFDTEIQLTNGTTPGHVLIFGAGKKCKFGEDVTGGGTVLCAEGKLSMEERVQWNGALLGGKKVVRLRDAGTLTHAPLLIFPE